MPVRVTAAAIRAKSKNSSKNQLNLFSLVCQPWCWEEVRSRNGWVNIHNSGDDFLTFLDNQEKVIGDLMRKLGFL